MAIYLKYDGIDGEATHQDHQKWIDIQDVRFAVGRAISTPVGSTANREASQPNVSEVTISRQMDAASPKLFVEAVTGGTGKTVKIDLVSTGSPGNTYVTYTLTNTLVAGYQVQSSGDRPAEVLSLSFTKLEFKMTPFDATGKAGTPTAVSYDLATGKSG